MAETRRPPPPPADVPKPPSVRYACPCGGFLCESDATVGVLYGVLCSKCKQRRTVFLGGKRSAAQVAEARLRESA